MAARRYSLVGFSTKFRDAQQLATISMVSNNLALPLNALDAVMTIPKHLTPYILRIESDTFERVYCSGNIPAWRKQTTVDVGLVKYRVLLNYVCMKASGPLRPHMCCIPPAAAWLPMVCGEHELLLSVGTRQLDAGALQLRWAVGEYTAKAEAIALLWLLFDGHHSRELGPGTVGAF